MDAYVQVTSWIAVGVIGLIGVITLLRVLLWLRGVHRCHGSADISQSLVEHDQLGGNDQLHNVLSSSYDGKPISPPPPYD